MLPLESPEVQFTYDLVRDAARLVRQVQSEMVTAALTKGDRSPVTVADFAAQALVGCRLDESFPAEPLVGEEDSAVLRTPEQRTTLENITIFLRQFVPSATPDRVCRWIDRGRAASAPRYWTVDPIDGTKGFLRGDQYAVALALVEAGQVQIGALGCPSLSLDYLLAPDPPQVPMRGRTGSLVIAVRGAGTWATSLEGDREFVRLRTSDRSDPVQARLMRSFEAGHTNVGQIGTLVEALKVQAEPVCMDSQAKYAVLAAGHGDLLVRLLSEKQPDYREKIWDQAAGSLIVEEAGGTITDLHGKPLDFTTGRTLARNRGVLASNGLLHLAALNALNQIGV